MIELKEIKVFITTVATGKSWLALNDDRFFDLDDWFVKYKYGIDEHKTYAELETLKSSKLKQVRFDEKEKTIEKMNEVIGQGKIVFMNNNEFFIEHLLENNIPYCFVYNKQNANDEIIERLRKRGNPKEWYQSIADKIAEWREFNAQDVRPTIKIELNKGEYLADILSKVFPR